MKSKIVSIKDYLWEHKIILIFVIGFMARLFALGNLAGNHSVYQDEAFPGYEAWSLINYGHDSHGYTMPVYFETWGSGMSAMQIYLMVPCVALFGLSSFSIRIPQAVLGCLTLVAFYFFMKRIRNEKTALIGAAIFAIIPWHIMMSRWALDCYFLPGFLLFSQLFLLKAEDDNKWFMVSMLFYGLSLYCYAAAWVMMPFIVGIQSLYMLFSRKIKFDKYIIIGYGILVIVALPLLLFVLVNWGFINEIVTPFISIPKLALFRTDEMDLSLKSMLQHLYDTFVMMVTQDDGRLTNATPQFGLYYKFSLIFIIIGLGISLKSIIKKENTRDIIMWVQMIAGFALGSTIVAYFSRINIIHIPMIFFLVIGLSEVINYFGEKAKYILFVVYAASFMMFSVYYVAYHDDLVAESNYDGIGQALKALKETEHGTVHILSWQIMYPYVLYYDQYPTDLFIETVDYDPDTTRRYLFPRTFEGYDYMATIEDEPVSGDVYMCVSKDEEMLKYMQDNNMQITNYNYVYVGIAQ
ncbi:MAG: glycosyltransferase family 39 protein [Butyrivibrio sp.]|nr:glycosyltransferase family 39 protein [Butyrivibrio sp.]